MKKDSRILIIGIRNMDGIALLQYFQMYGFCNVSLEAPSDADLMNPVTTRQFFDTVRPEYVFVTHIKSGGIQANMRYPAELMQVNLMVQSHVIQAAYESGVKHLLYLGSSCAYPKECPQPITEDALLSGPLESTSEAYSIAKIAGIKLCQAYRRQYGVNYFSVIPATIYGPHDHFDLERSHVMSALIRKFHEAKLARTDTVTLWGSGQPRREFIYVDDLVDACLLLMEQNAPPDLINVGPGVDVAIKDLAELIREVVGFEGNIRFDTSKPDGTFQKLLDNRQITKLGWQAKTSLREGVERTYQWYQTNAS